MKIKLLFLSLLFVMTNVVYCQLVSIHIIPVNPILPQSTTYGLRAIGVYADNHTQNITGSCIWTSGSPTIVQAFSAGQAYPFGIGTAFGGEIITNTTDGTSLITATIGPISGTTLVTVSSDVDGDGEPNNFDNCIITSNPLQMDNDADMIGDACECSIATPNPGTPYIGGITIYAFPSNTITAGQTVTFYSSVDSSTYTTNGALFNYQWTKNGLPVGSNTPEYADAALVNGDVIACVVTDEYYCILGGSQTSNLITISITPLAVLENDFAANTIVLYPNPASKYLNVTSKATILFTEIIDINGRTILSSSQNTTQVRLATEDFTPGIYVVKITTEKGTAAQKIILTKG
jgi:hypothetical protein